MARTIHKAVAVTGAVMMIWLPLAARGAEGIPMPLSDVPTKVVEAARSVADGIEVLGVRAERTDKGVLYHFRTLSKGKPYKVVVDAGGEVLRIEAIESKDKSRPDSGQEEGKKDTDAKAEAD